MRYKRGHILVVIIISLLLAVEIISQKYSLSGRNLHPSFDIGWDYSLNSTGQPEAGCRRPIALCPAPNITCACCSEVRVTKWTMGLRHVFFFIIGTYLLCGKVKIRRLLKQSKIKRAIRRMNSYAEQVSERVTWLFCMCFAPCFLRPLPENTLNESRPMKKRKNKIIQTSGLRCPDNHVPYTCYDQRMRQNRNEIRRLLSRIMKMINHFRESNNHKKERLGTMTKLLSSTNMEIFHDHRELIFLEKYARYIQQRLGLQKQINKHTITLYEQVCEQLEQFHLPIQGSYPPSDMNKGVEL